MVRIEVESNRAEYRPGEAVAGIVRWELEEEPAEVRVRLGWVTRGKGIPDRAVVAEARPEHAGRSGELVFRLAVPEGPYSFAGKLTSLLWFVEAQAGGEEDRVQVSVSPDGMPIRLAGPGINPLP